MDKESVENKVDGILKRVRKSKYSAVVIAVYSFVWYLIGYYVGDVVHTVRDWFA